MMDFRQLKSWKHQQLTSVLGLSLDGGRLEGCVLRRANGAIQLEQSFSVSLSLDPLTNDPELVGREIRNHLDAAEARERRCVVALPLKWALTAHTKLPDLPEEDVASFLHIEAERSFPSDVATLHLAVSRCRIAQGESYATQVGIPRNHVALLERALRAAQLKPLSFSLGIAALQTPGAEASNGVLALAIGENSVGLQVACGGGVMALRTLEGALLTEGSQRQLQAEVVAREARITLGQLPADFREAVRRVRIFGPRDLAQQLADEIELRLEPMGLKVEVAAKYAADEFAAQLPPGAAVSPAFSLAAARLTGRIAPFEFLPPKVTPWQQMAARYSSGKLRTTLTAAGSVALLTGGLFLFQQVQLWGLGSQWNKIRGKVGELQDVQGKISQYRPWFDEPVRALTIMRRLTEAFPEDGSVTAKTVEVRDLNTVVCSGVARDSRSLQQTLAKLRAMPDVSDASILSTRGQAQSLQFTFNFKWNETASHGN